MFFGGHPYNENCLHCLSKSPNKEERIRNLRQFIQQQEDEFNNHKNEPYISNNKSLLNLLDDIRILQNQFLGNPQYAENASQLLNELMDAGVMKFIIFIMISLNREVHDVVCVENKNVDTAQSTPSLDHVSGEGQDLKQKVDKLANICSELLSSLTKRNPFHQSMNNEFVISLVTMVCHYLRDKRPFGSPFSVKYNIMQQLMILNYKTNIFRLCNDDFASDIEHESKNVSKVEIIADLILALIDFYENHLQNDQVINEQNLKFHKIENDTCSIDEIYSQRYIEILKELDIQCLSGIFVMNASLIKRFQPFIIQKNYNFLATILNICKEFPTSYYPSSKKQELSCLIVAIMTCPNPGYNPWDSETQFIDKLSLQQLNDCVDNKLATLVFEAWIQIKEKGEMRSFVMNQVAKNAQIYDSSLSSASKMSETVEKATLTLLEAEQHILSSLSSITEYAFINDSISQWKQNQLMELYQELVNILFTDSLHDQCRRKAKLMDHPIEKGYQFNIAPENTSHSNFHYTYVEPSYRACAAIAMQNICIHSQESQFHGQLSKWCSILSDHLKSLGNDEYFRKGDYEGAVWYYTIALRLMKLSKETNEERIKCLSNRCNCFLRLKNYEAAKRDVKCVLGWDPEHKKCKHFLSILDTK